MQSELPDYKTLILNLPIMKMFIFDFIMVDLDYFLIHEIFKL